jgi:hypothetical protein
LLASTNVIAAALHKLAAVKLQQVVLPLAHAHIFHRQAKLIRDGDDDPALGGAVQLCEHNARDTCGFLKLLCLISPF